MDCNGFIRRTRKEEKQKNNRENDARHAPFFNLGKKSGIVKQAKRQK
jgi:hypothetical protein